MKFNKIILIIITSLIIVVVVWDINREYTVYPNTIDITNIDVTDNFINVKGEFNGSAVWYEGYKTKYDNGNLYITILGLKLAPASKGSINISIPNNFGKIDAIYLTGDRNNDDILIWPKN